MKDAVSAYSDAIEIDGERCYAYSDYAYMLYFVAIRMNPINFQALNYAKDYSSTAIALGHDPDNYLTRAMINSALKNYGEALIDCDEAIKYSPKYFRPYLKRADIKIFDLGQIDDGLVDAERALALAGTNQEKAVKTKHRRGNGQGSAYKRGSTWTGQTTGYSYYTVENGKKNLQNEVSDPEANGTGIAFISSISQNAQGVISATKKEIGSLTWGQLSGTT